MCNVILQMPLPGYTDIQKCPVLFKLQFEIALIERIAYGMLLIILNSK